MIRETKTLEGFQFQELDFDDIVRQGEPCIFKGALNRSPLVIAGKQSEAAAMSYLQPFSSPRPLLYFKADANANTRFFYTQEMDGFNYDTGHTSFAEFCENLNLEKQQASNVSLYVGSAELEDHFPGLLSAAGLGIGGDVFDTHAPSIGIWLGNRTTASTHYDVSNNIAACVVGRRRFTLFPPDQIGNLYPGPLEPTPAGQVVSMVDLNAPDLHAYPNFSKALEQAQVAELEAGDVLVYPAMWWHQVEALNDFNVLVNYWWNTVPAFVDDPMNTLLHSLLSLRDRPDNEKEAWRAVFDYYVFGDADRPRKHLPEKAWGTLGALDQSSARRLRAKLLKKFNR